MKRNFTFLTFMLLALVSFAQDENAEDKFSAGLSLTTDQFFGLAPMMTFSYDVSETGSFTAYGIQWAAGTGAAWGQWTEFGFGYNVSAGDFDINPQLGFTFGNLLSGNAGNALNEGIIGDGIVPNLTVNYGNDQFEGQLYFGYYAPLSDNAPSEGTTLAYTHYWLNFGYKVNDFFSFGAHYEDLALVGGSEVGDGTGSVYTGIGPYVQFTKGNAGLRLSAGPNIADEDNANFASNEFYKLSFFISL